MAGSLEYFVNSMATVLFLPLWVILIIFINSAVSLIDSKKFTVNLSLGAGCFSLIFAIISLVYCIQNTGVVIENNLPWLNLGMQVFLGTLVDSLSSVFLVVFSLILVLIQVYAYRYMQDDKGFHRFYIYLNLLAFAVYGFVLSTNLIQSLIFMGLIGVVGYFAIGFRSDNNQAECSARTYLTLNCLGDACLLLGVVALVYFAVVFTFAQNVVLLAYSGFAFNIDTMYSMVSEPIFCVIAFLILFGLCAKSAQFPFSPASLDTSCIPFPYFALIPIILGGSSMYFISRIYPLVLMSKTVLGVMLIIGLISAFVSAFIAMSQDNIKKILMYLMVSQFGVALSLFALGAYSVANRFTLIVVVAMTLLCVVGGYVVRCAGKEENIKMLGGLKHHLPVCAVVFGIASAFLIGCNFMQRNILTLLYQVGNEFIFWGYLCVLFLMVYSLARVYFLIFCGVKKEDFAIDKTSKIMFVPIAVLIMFLIGLFVLVSKFDDFIYFITPEKSVSVGIVPIVLGGFVIFGAVYISAMLYCAPYNVFTKVKERVLSRENFLYKLSYNELYYREICAWGGSKIFLPLCKAIDFVEKNVVESLISVIVLTTKFFVSIVSKIYDKNGKNSILFAIVLLAVVVIVIAGLYVIGSLMGV